MKWKPIAAIVLACALPEVAHSASVSWRITNGGTTTTTTQTVTGSAPYDDITIDLSAFSTATDVQVYTTGGGFSTSLHDVVIKGTGSYTVRLAIADGSTVATVTAAFGSSPITLHPDPGLTNLHGVSFVPATGQSTTLRDTTAVTVNTRGGEISGEVGAGMIYHVDCKRNSADTAGGTISGTIRSTAKDAGVLGGDADANPSIGYVNAWKLTGSITADGPGFSASDYTTWGSAGRIVVGPSTPSSSFVAMSGTVNCPNGQVHEILSTGRIGTDGTHLTTITAGTRIGRISMRTETNDTGGDPHVEALPIYANVEASDANAPDPTVGSSISLIETGHDYVGDIHLYQVTTTNPQPERTSHRHGIFVGGKFQGDITVEKDYARADMIARSFRGTISIGKFFEGCIVAVGHETPTDGADGTIAAVSIGNNGVATQVGEYPHGFSGVANGQLMPAPFEGHDTDRLNWYTQEAPSSTETMDSVIRADTYIAWANIYAMSGQLAGGPKPGRPRLEAPTMGWIYVGAMDNGSIWSGVLNNLDPYDDINDDYADVQTLTIGCMGPLADLWVTHCGSIDILGDMFGEIHGDELGSIQRLRIGGKLGNLQQSGLSEPPESTPCDPELEFYQVGVVVPNDGSEKSPRCFWEEEDLSYTPSGAPRFEGLAEYSRIRIQADAGLHGQIILNANSETATPLAHGYWVGDVMVGTGDPNGSPASPKVFSTEGRATELERVGPYYEVSKSADGGGAIGLVPYSRHPNDSIPAQDEEACDMHHETTWASPSNRETIVISHYGPVVNHETGMPLKVERQSLLCPYPCSSPPSWNDITASCTFLMSQGTNRRDVWVSLLPVGGVAQSFGIMYNYMVTPIVDGNTYLRSDDTFASPDPDVYAYVHLFSIELCEQFGRGESGGSGPHFYTEDDLDFLLTVDFNRDGVVDEADAQILFERLESGE